MTDVQTELFSPVPTVWDVLVFSVKYYLPGAVIGLLGATCWAKGSLAVLLFRCGAMGLMVALFLSVPEESLPYFLHNFIGNLDSVVTRYWPIRQYT